MKLIDWGLRIRMKNPKPCISKLKFWLLPVRTGFSVKKGPFSDFAKNLLISNGKVKEPFS